MRSPVCSFTNSQRLSRASHSAYHGGETGGGRAEACEPPCRWPCCWPCCPECVNSETSSLRKPIVRCGRCVLIDGHLRSASCAIYPFMRRRPLHRIPAANSSSRRYFGRVGRGGGAIGLVRFWTLALSKQGPRCAVYQTYNVPETAFVPPPSCRSISGVGLLKLS